jgi:hypothetical protein
MRVGFTPVVRDEDLVGPRGRRRDVAEPLVEGATTVNFGTMGGDR